MGNSHSRPPPPARDHGPWGAAGHASWDTADSWQPPNHKRSNSHNQHRNQPRQNQLRRASLQAFGSAPAPAPTMPSFFSFQQGSERAQNVRYLSEASPLLGRYRAVPRPNDRAAGGPARNGGRGPASQSQMGLLSVQPGWRNSVHVGYGALVAAAAAAEEESEGADDGDDEDEDDEDGEDGEAGCCCASDGGRRWRKAKGRIRRLWRRFGDTWIDPKASVIRGVVNTWWSRWGTLVVLPALLVCCP